LFIVAVVVIMPKVAAGKEEVELDDGKPTKKAAAANAKAKAPAVDAATTKKRRGWDEIESLFDGKKAKATKQQAQKREEESATEKKQQQKKGNNTTKKPAAGSSRPRPPPAAAAHHNDDTTSTWVDDGLGGRFNGEGYTGRVQDGVKIFKAHVLSKPNAGQTPNCPFDCDCCYI
jgi:hypothetical protein